MRRRMLWLTGFVVVLAAAAGAWFWIAHRGGDGRWSSAKAQTELAAMNHQRLVDLTGLHRPISTSQTRLLCIDLEQDDLDMASAVAAGNWPAAAERTARVLVIALRGEAHGLSECSTLNYGAATIIDSAPAAEPAIEQLREILGSAGPHLR